METGNPRRSLRIAITSLRISACIWLTIVGWFIFNLVTDFIVTPWAVLVSMIFCAPGLGLILSAWKSRDARWARVSAPILICLTGMALIMGLTLIVLGSGEFGWTRQRTIQTALMLAGVGFHVRSIYHLLAGMKADMTLPGLQGFEAITFTPTQAPLPENRI